MTDTDKIIEKIIDDLCEDADTASQLFGKPKTKVKAWLKTKASDPAMGALRRCFHPLSAKIEKALNYQDILEEFCFFMTVPKMREAMKAFDECGSVQIIINRNEKGSGVVINKMATDVIQTPQEREEVPEGPPKSLDEMTPEELQQVELASAQGQPVPTIRHEIQVVETPVEATPSAARTEAEPHHNGTGRKVAILIATNRDFVPAVNYSIIGSERQASKLWGLDNVRIAQENDTDIWQARNALATHFIRDLTEFEWTFWMDSDNIVPIGLPGWFNRWTERRIAPEFAGAIAIEKLTSGPHKFVSGVYVTRDSRRILVNKLGLSPDGRDKDIAMEIARGPSNRRIPIPWTGFGCVAVHRDVFLDIMKACPEIMPEKEKDPIRFFLPDNCSEDISFCKRAGKAGHRPVLDLSVWSAHVGRLGFLPLAPLVKPSHHL